MFLVPVLVLLGPTCDPRLPPAVEVCNGLDDDRDGVVDEPDAVDAPTWYADADGDGFGDPEVTAIACVPARGYVRPAGDCDDTDAAASPTGTESCDGVDQDCDGVADEGATCGPPQR